MTSQRRARHAWKWLPVVWLAVGVLLALSGPLEAGPDDPARSADDARRIAERRHRARTAGRVLDDPFYAGGRGMAGPPLLGAVWSPGRPSLADGTLRPMLRHDIGAVFDGGRPLGFHEGSYRGVPVTVLSCAFCHSGRAAGRTIPGLGNKTVDVVALARHVRSVSPLSALFAGLRGPAARTLERRSQRLVRHLTAPQHASPTQGLHALLSTSRWMFEGTGIPVEADAPLLGTKTPHLWGYRTKRETGTFCDGFGKGIGWLALQRVMSGQTQATVRRDEGKLERFVAATDDLLPPRYPFAVDRAAASRGETVFQATCARCHGAYERDALGFPVYAPPKAVPIDVVGTDRERFDGYKSDALFARLDRLPMGDMLEVHADRIGYLAPRLDGIWSRFPYLHNASVPSLADMLLPPPRRPRAWSLRDAVERHRFDSRRVGLTLPTSPRGRARLEACGRRGVRAVYWTGRPGHGNHGHPFGTDLPARDKRDLIEFLKTL
jgi:hypothetical protein